MRSFALVWTLGFLVALVPVMRWDRRRRIRRAWANITEGTIALGAAFVAIGRAASSAAESMRAFESAFRASSDQPRH